MSGVGPGRVKTRLGEGSAELFSQLPSSERSCQYNDSHIDEIEMEVVQASWTSEFSHSLGQKRKCPGSRGASVLPSGADIVSLTRYVRLVPEAPPTAA
jgi:hypothetical protein